VSGGVTRLPKQPRTRPHCPGCEKELPQLNSVTLSMSAFELDRGHELLATIYVVRCPCGSEVLLRKECKNPERTS